MSTPDRKQLGALLDAHACRTLTRREELRLRELVGCDPELAAELAAVDQLHGLLDDERALREEVAAPPTSAEEADEGFRRLQAAAATAERELRAQLEFGGAVTAAVRGGTVRRFPVWAIAAAAVVAVVGLAFLLFGADAGRPDLDGNTPDGRTLGGNARIVLRAEVDPERPLLSWHPVVGASRYDATVEDAAGRTVLQRIEQRAGSTTWELTRDQIEELRGARDAGGELRLRIVARDGAGLPVASSGDLPLRLLD